MYRNTRFSLAQSWVVGFFTYCARRVTGKEISGRVPTERYMRLPTACLYSALSNISFSISASVGCPSMGETTGFELSIPNRSKTFSAYRDWLRYSILFERSLRVSKPRHTPGSPQSSILNCWQNSLCRRVRSFKSLAAKLESST